MSGLEGATVPRARAPLAVRVLAELIGSAFLAALVVGSGIAAQTLSPGNVGLEMFENAAATAAGLFAIILMVGAVSGGHFNPMVSLVDAVFGGIAWRDVGAYVPAQIAGCVGGTVIANAMFSLPAVSISQHDRTSAGHWLGEVVATLGLLLVIFALARSHRAHVTPAAVGAYIGAAYFFTSSASFANPAITVGRMFSNTFAGIAPGSAPGYIAAQLVGGAVAVAVIRTLYPDVRSADVIVPFGSEQGRPVSASTAISGDDTRIASSAPRRPARATAGVTADPPSAQPYTASSPPT